ncbi:TIGR02530 family flagellar biosynthesis protein [Sporofaciens musculi]|uniref:TIGR02530 family flagellar biosynthesis protein n=1 Tax=Sporofaciens musculi TaxID=2681861 RepID=UPI00257087DE|nr:TIGR02530 family flagellar biosynthesis protein [Sporofaciens musculi]
MTSNVNQITNAGTLKLQHAQTALQTRGNTGNQMQFAKLLQEEAGRPKSVQFSKHAAQRVQQRGIEMTDSLLTELNQAVAKAQEKGAKDVVVIGKSGAFIVNVPNNIVVTTMSGAEMKENIFTNIDSAVLI